MSAEHRRPFAAFVVVFAAACLIMGNGLRSQVADVLVGAGAPPALVTAIAPDVLLGQSLDSAPQAQARPTSEGPTVSTDTGQQAASAVVANVPPAPAATATRPTSSRGGQGSGSRPGTGGGPQTAPAAVAPPAATPAPKTVPATPTPKPAPTPVAPPTQNPGVISKPDKPSVAPVKPGSGIGKGHHGTTSNPGLVPAPDKGTDKGSDKGTDKGTGKSPDKAPGRSPDRGPDKSGDRGPDRAPGRGPGHGSDHAQDRGPDRGDQLSHGPRGSDSRGGDSRGHGDRGESGDLGRSGR